MKRPQIPALIAAISLFITCTPKYTLNYTRPEKSLNLPEDEAAHYGYQMEWWYYTGHLKADDGNEYGYEVTFFKRITNEDKVPGCIIPVPAHWLKDVGMIGHFAITDLTNKKFYADEINNFISSWKAERDIYHIGIQSWSAVSVDGKHHLKAQMKRFEINLELDPMKAAALNGPNGIVNKGGTQANYYYSYTNLKTSGNLTVDGVKHQVTGKSWMDHEYGTMELTHSQKGWDWFSIQLDNNSELMLYMIRDNNNLTAESGGTFVHPDGKTVWLKLKDIEIRNLNFWQSRETDSNYPAEWEIKIKSLNLTLRVKPKMAEQELNLKPIPYWEGAVNISGTSDRTAVKGSGYVELVGYSKKYTFDDVDF